MLKQCIRLLLWYFKKFHLCVFHILAPSLYNSYLQNNKYNTLTMDQLFGCEQTTNTSNTVCSHDYRSVKGPPAEDRLYEVKKEPYITYLNAIADTYLRRPTSLYDKARYLLFGKCLHHVVLPVCLVRFLK